MTVAKHIVPAERSSMAKKRTNGEGHIRQRKNGLWECTIMDGFQPNGKRKLDQIKAYDIEQFLKQLR